MTWVPHAPEMQLLIGGRVDEMHGVVVVHQVCGLQCAEHGEYGECARSICPHSQYTTCGALSLTEFVLVSFCPAR